MLIKILGILLIVLGLLVFTIHVLYVRLKQTRITNELTMHSVNLLQDKLVDKVRDKIEFTQRSHRMRKQKDELIASYIYKQDVVQELGEELRSIYSVEFAALQERYPSLTDLDLLMLCLLGMEMTNDEICEIVHMEKRTLYRRRQLISQRMGISSTELEHFSLEYFSAD